MQRLSPGTLILGVFAVLVGLLGAYGVKKLLDRPAVAAPVATVAKVQPHLVPVAADDLPVGRTVEKDDVVSMPMTPEQMEKAKLPAIWMARVEQIAGRMLRTPLKRGQPFEPTSFYPKGMGPNVADALKPGERAVTIPLEHDSPDAKFLTPGAMVDVLFRSKADAAASVPDVTVTLLSGARVLAIGQNTVAGVLPETSPGGDKATVTLAVNQAQARALAVAEGRGSLTLVLRNAQDSQTADAGGPSNLPGMLGIKQPPEPFVSEMYRGTYHSSAVFRDGMREKVTLDPPYGMPVSDTPQEKKQKPIEAWYPGYGGGWGGGWGYGGYGSHIGGGDGNYHGVTGRGAF